MGTNGRATFGTLVATESSARVSTVAPDLGWDFGGLAVAHLEDNGN